MGVGEFMGYFALGEIPAGEPTGRASPRLSLIGRQ